MVTILKTLSILLLLSSLGLPSLRGQSQKESEIARTHMKQLVDFVTVYLEDMDPQKPGFVPRNASHTHDVDPAYPLAYLYKTQHPLNPYFQQRDIRDTAIAICDRIAAERMRPEWPLYLVGQVYDLLKDEVPAEKARAWKAYAEDYIQTRGIQPYFYTSPNHEAWNAVAIFRAGQVFGEQSWMDYGRRLMHQLIKLQTGLGYFDEGKHHGPTMKYNQTQLAPMLLFHDYADDPVTLKASRKLADFMIRYSFPDGSPIGTFDGRQSYSFGFYGTSCYGMDRWPLGKELNRRIYRTRKRWDVLDVKSPFYAFSEWYAYFGLFFLLDEYRSLRPDAPAAPLPQDANGYRMVESSPSFDGGVVRQHDWMVAMSALVSDVPRYHGSVYQLERQSRLDVWHEKTGLIIGGGHNMVKVNPPLANFLLLTGHAGVKADFGLLEGGQNDNHRRAAYFPRNAEVRMELNEQILEANFGHGDFAFTVKPVDERRLEIVYGYDVLHAEDAYVQLPIIVYHNSKVRVDDATAYDGFRSLAVKREIRIGNPTTDSTLTIHLPRGKSILLREPVYPLRWYGGDHRDQRYRPYYKIALLSVKIEPPTGKGNGRFLLEIEDGFQP